MAGDAATIGGIRDAPRGTKGGCREERSADAHPDAFRYAASHAKRHAVTLCDTDSVSIGYSFRHAESVSKPAPLSHSFTVRVTYPKCYAATDAVSLANSFALADA